MGRKMGILVNGSFCVMNEKGYLNQRGHSVMNGKWLLKLQKISFYFDNGHFIKRRLKLAVL